MEIKDFAVEQWMDEWETKCTYNVAETCVFSVSLDELFEICETDATAFMAEQAKRPLTYGDIEGNPAFLEGVASLYKTIEPHHIIPTHGAAGANMLALSTLTGPGKRVVSIMPTYQQLYSIPEMCGADVRILHLEKDDAYHVNINRLREVCSDGADVICINNPDNPTGALLSEEELRGILPGWYAMRCTACSLKTERTNPLWPTCMTRAWSPPPCRKCGRSPACAWVGALLAIRSFAASYSPTATTTSSPVAYSTRPSPRWPSPIKTGCSSAAIALSPKICNR